MDDSWVKATDDFEHEPCGAKLFSIAIVTSYEGVADEFFACVKCERLLRVKRPREQFEKTVITDVGWLTDSYMSMFVVYKFEDNEQRVRLRSKYKARCVKCGKSIYEHDTAYWKKAAGLVCNHCFWGPITNLNQEQERLI